MNKSNIVEQENKQLRAQLESVQENLIKSRHVFQQIENFSSKLGHPVELKEIYRNCLYLFKDLLSLDFTTLFLKGSEPDSLISA